MYYYSVFQQLFKFVPRYRFEKSMEKQSGDRYCKHFTMKKTPDWNAPEQLDLFANYCNIF